MGGRSKDPTNHAPKQCKFFFLSGVFKYLVSGNVRVTGTFETTISSWRNEANGRLIHGYSGYIEDMDGRGLPTSCLIVDNFSYAFQSSAFSKEIKNLRVDVIFKFYNAEIKILTQPGESLVCSF